MASEYPVVKVIWADCVSDSAWQPLAKIKEYPPVWCTTVGFLLYKDRFVIRLCDTLSEDGDGANAIIIPKGWVREFTCLVDPSAPLPRGPRRPRRGSLALQGRGDESK